MNAKSTLKQGVQVALGVFIGWTIVIPLIGLFEWKFGLMAGVLAALLVLVSYCLLSACATVRAMKARAVAVFPHRGLAPISSRPCQAHTKRSR